MDKALKRKGNNPLLAKDDIGKCKPCSYQLPGDGFAYGRPERKDAEGAREVTSSWAYHQQSNVASSKKDFKNMNKSGVQKGAVDAKKQKELRKQKDLRVSNEPKHKLGKKVEPPQDMVYGIMNRPSTPIQGVIANSYGQIAEQEAEEIYKASVHKPKKKHNPAVRPTKAVEKLMEHQKTKGLEDKNEKAENFKIKKFTKVESRVKAQLKKSSPKKHQQPAEESKEQ